MIVKNETDHFIGIPVITAVGKDYVYGEPVDLPPGYKEIPDETWALARKQVMDKLSEGILREECAKVDKADGMKASLVIEEGATDKDKWVVPIAFYDIERKGNRLSNIIKNTFDLPTLEKWYTNDTRQDIRVELQKQIDGINNGTIKG